MMVKIRKITENNVISTSIKNSPSSLEITQATVYKPQEHGLVQTQINPIASQVLSQLNQAGYEAYLVGGCVRDLLLGREPKDFDVATNAHPEQVKKVFHNCRLIGRRFRLAHIYFGREIIEVATFRGSSETTHASHKIHADGRLLRDNIYGTLEEDAERRDFTVNALYYSIESGDLIDYVQGMTHLRKGELKLIGNPELRYREDPVRMLRAIRFAVKLGFTLHPNSQQPIHQFAPLLTAIPNARLYDESLKLFLSGYALPTFEMLRHYGLFVLLFPQTDACLAIEDQDVPRAFLIKALKNSDKRVAEGKSITPYFLLSAFLWEALQINVKKQLQAGENKYFALQYAANTVLKQQVKILAIPKRVTQSMRDVWTLQARFEQRSHSHVHRLVNHPRFRAAYDFLVLRAETGGADPALAQWWTHFQAVEPPQQEKMIRALNQRNRKHHRRSSKKIL